MSDNLQIHKFKIIIIEKICQNKKFVTFVISFVKDNSKTIQVVFYAL